jgi:hypothetical protein
MRPFNVKLLGCIGLFMVLAMLINGCGSGNDLLDEVGGRTTFDMELLDGDEDNVQQIDVSEIQDCNGDGTLDDPEDPLTPVLGEIIVTVASDSPGLSLLSYVVNYIPVLTVDENNVYQTPVTILSKSGQFNSFNVDSGGEGSDSFIIMTLGQKAVVYDYLAVTPTLVTALYTIEVVLTYQDYEGNTTTRSVYRDVEIGHIDRCS